MRPSLKSSRARNVFLGSLIAVALSSVAGCKAFFGAPVPMHSVKLADPHGPAKCLLVLLPGMGDSDRTFMDEGFVELIRRKSISVDLVAGDATIGYYMRGIMPQRLEEDVLAPTHGKYEKTWMLGVSMGGMGALLYAHEHPKNLDGIVLFSAYLGDDPIIDEVRKAGGPAKWTPPAKAPLTEDNYQRQAWGYLSNLVSKRENGPELYVGYGKKDKSGPADRVLADDLPETNVFIDEGDHNWGPWRRLLTRFLEESSFSKDCAREAEPAAAKP